MSRVAAIALVGMLWWMPGQAAIDSFQFEDPQREAQFQQLAAELRCLVCQNQSLADSNAGLALDLRRKVYEMVQAGQSDQEIVDYMVARYGDFVLYRPPVKPQTYLLWAGPLILLLLGSVLLVRFVRGREQLQSEALTPEEQGELERLLRSAEEKHR